METTTATAWPILPGAYQVGDPQAPVAVCALTSLALTAPLARLPGVAIAGNVYTANHGIERIVFNIIANPSVRFLLLCGKDATLFQPAQSLVALGERGVDGERRIVGAAGYDPVLPTASAEQVAQFRAQVDVVDWTGEDDLGALADRIRALAARSPGRFVPSGSVTVAPPAEARFVPIRPGGQREPLQYDPKGYFVITLDRDQDQIVLRHYLPDHSPAHEMRGRSAGPMLLGLLREGLVSQLSHAGYLGEELAKAQAALQTGWLYSQDRPLRPAEQATPSASEPQHMPRDQQAPGQSQDAPAVNQGGSMSSGMSRVGPALTWAQLEVTPLGATVDVVMRVTQSPGPGQLVGLFHDPDAAESFGTFHPTQHQLEIRWSPATRIVMGEAADVHVGALLRARGTFNQGPVIDAASLVVITRVARIIES